MSPNKQFMLDNTSAHPKPEFSKVLGLDGEFFVFLGLDFPLPLQ